MHADVRSAAIWPRSVRWAIRDDPAHVGGRRHRRRCRDRRRRRRLVARQPHGRSRRTSGACGSRSRVAARSCVSRTARQAAAAQLLGNLVPALRRGNAAAGALPRGSTAALAGRSSAWPSIGRNRFRSLSQRKGSTSPSPLLAAKACRCRARWAMRRRATLQRCVRPQRHRSRTEAGRRRCAAS